MFLKEYDDDDDDDDDDDGVTLKTYCWSEQVEVGCHPGCVLQQFGTGDRLYV